MLSITTTKLYLEEAKHRLRLARYWLCDCDMARPLQGARHWVQANRGAAIAGAGAMAFIGWTLLYHPATAPPPQPAPPAFKSAPPKAAPPKAVRKQVVRKKAPARPVQVNKPIRLEVR